MFDNFRGSQQRTVALAAVVALTLSVTGCTTNANSGNTSPSSADTGKSGGSTGTLIVNNVFNNDGLDPAHETAVTANMVFHSVYDTLLTLEPGSTTPKPALASAYTASPDGKTFTFTLRTDVKFADGTPLTVDDVAFSFNRMINVKGAGAAVLDGVTVTTEGPDKVILTSAVPKPALPRIVAMAALGIVSAKAVKAQGGSDQAGADQSDKAQAWLNVNSAGSGPYKLKTVTPKQQYVLEANPHYWGTKPTFQQVIVKNAAAPAQLLSVQRGESEIAYDIAANQVGQLAGNSAVQVVRAPSTNIFFFMANLDPAKSPVTANPKIREAIRYGLDYEGLRKLGGDGAIQLAGLVPKGMLGALPESERVQRDVARAKALVAESGLKNPTFTLNYVANFSIFGVSVELVAQKIQASLAEVGITATPQGLPLQQHIQRFREGKQQASANLYAVDYPDPANYLPHWPGGATATRLGIDKAKHPELVALHEKAATTVGDDARAAAYQELQRKMNDLGAYIPEFQAESILVGTANLTGLVSNGMWGVDLAKVGRK
ncbi:ABC transporter substrate-binding protein [Rhizohabitans arisaemae]|uniref:ABC transporter substrate-binding protein n=1 Tax=Rhizohabitans arisaemae TaxID=2720610 RepID=UPI0024B20595|nr:ABC transporter substrate-binding protein [Rhizohabitans arisaemae]